VTRCALLRGSSPDWGKRLSVLIVALLLACSASRPARYAEQQTLAERAYSAGRYREAGERWLEASQAAEAERDASEARFRAAASFERAGDLSRADAIFTELDREGGERAARALYERAVLAERRGEEARAQELYIESLRRYPTSGTSPTALDRHLRYVEQNRGEDAVLARLDELVRELAGGDLDERVRYTRARRLDRMGKTELALAAYLDTAARHPYPEGAFWDDALFRAASAEQKLGRPREAIALLERLLAEREEAHGPGSYERPRYAEARYAIAELYRDALDDSARARREFLRVWYDHPTTLLRDDALFQAALLARADHDTEQACAAARTLKHDAPDSRYAGCVSHLCPALEAPAGRKCRDYLERQYFASERGTESESGEP
jgi:tetratricopeptide (TPR) repeat protein